MKSNKSFLYGLVVMPLVLLGISIAIASNVEPLSQFQPGAVVSSSEVNSHLDRLRRAINDNDTRIESIENGTTVISANGLDGLQANQIVRSSYVEDLGTIDDFTGSTFSSILSNDVNVPADGILMIWGTVNAEWDVSSNANTFNRLLTRITIDGVPVGLLNTVEFQDEPVMGNNGVKVGTLTAAVPVTQGSKVVDIEARTQMGTSLIAIQDRNLVTLFIPYGNEGSQGSNN